MTLFSIVRLMINYRFKMVDSFFHNSKMIHSLNNSRNKLIFKAWVVWDNKHLVLKTQLLLLTLVVVMDSSQEWWVNNNSHLSQDHQAQLMKSLKCQVKDSLSKECQWPLHHLMVATSLLSQEWWVNNNTCSTLKTCIINNSQFNNNKTSIYTWINPDNNNSINNNNNSNSSNMGSSFHQCIIKPLINRTLWCSNKINLTMNDYIYLNQY